MQNSAFLTWGLFILSSTLIASGVHAETERRTFEVATGEGFVLDADWGEVEVRTWGRAAIDVVVERADKVDLEYDQHNGTLTVRSRKKDKGLSRWFGERGRSPAFRISVPNRTDLSLATQGGNVGVDDHEGEVIAQTSGGKIVIGEVNGNVDGRTSGGSIAIAGATGSVKATTSGGTIRLGRASAAVEATTAGGSIHVEHAKGPVLARTSGGSIELADVEGSVDARTTGGTIRAGVSGQPSQDSALHTSGGSIHLALAEGIALDIDARTIGGRVSADFPVTADGPLGKSKLNGTVNGGGPRMILRTMGGSIRLDKM